MPRTIVRPARRASYLVGDLIFAAWVLIWALVGSLVQGVIKGLATPVVETARITGDLAQRFEDAANRLKDVAMVGDELAAPFEPIADTLTNLSNQAGAQADTVHSVAFLVFLIVWLMPSLTYGLFYLPRRIRRAREAAQARRYIDERADLDLFALRAMANSPMTKLAKISDNPVGAWRAGDRRTINELAELELKRVGIGVLKD